MPIPVLFPIEVTSRELDARLLLAAHCVGPDRSIFLGQDRSIFRLARRWRGGVYVGKQVLVGGLKPNLVKYRALKERGFKVLFLAEEEPVFSPEADVDRVQFLQMFHPDWLDSDDVICAWGEFSAEVFRSVARKDAADIQVTGHPRFDLCKPEMSGLYQDEIKAIQKRFGSFILLNTKFAAASNLPALLSAKKAFTGKTAGGKPDEYWLKVYCYHAKLQTAYIELANRLRQEFPDYHIVLRPHPGEDPAWYRATLEGIEGVSVLTEGGVLPWLAAAAVLVHTGCTTGLEACHLTAKIIQYAPEVGQAFEQDLPSLVGVVCATEDDVVKQIKSGELPRITSAAQHRIERIIGNFAPQLVSSERIGHLVATTANSMEEEPRTGRLAEWEHMLRSLFAGGRKSRGAVGGTAGVPRKFEPLNPEVIQRKLTFLETLVQKRLKARFISPYLMEIRQDCSST